MFLIKNNLSGVCGLAASPRRDQILADLSRATLTQALTEYASGRLRISVKDRFQPGAFPLYGFTGRSTNYRKKQIRAMGSVRPYVSPRRSDLSSVAVKLAQASRGMTAGAVIAVIREVSKAMTPRMRDLVLRPGIGHRVAASGRRVIQLRLVWPGARALNRGRDGGISAQIYRSEFADLTRGANRDWKAIAMRSAELFNAALAATLAKSA